MSHAATKWAFDQPEAIPDMKPAEWAVLVILADCHNPVHGCFPSQEYLCRRTNLSERAVRDHLARLRERGLINWEAAREAGKRGSNRYYLACEDGFQPAESAGSESTVSTGRNEHFQPADSDSFNRQNLPPNLVIEPVRESLSCADARESASEPAAVATSEREDDRVWEGRFWKLVKAHPDSAGMPKGRWLAAFMDLGDEDRRAAIDRHGAWLDTLRRQGRSHVPALSTYFAERLFAEIEPARPAATVERLAAFGKGWMAQRLHLLHTVPARPWQPTAAQRALVEAGKGHLLDDNRRRGQYPAIAAMDADGERMIGAWPVQGVPLAAAEAYPRIRRGSDEWLAWENWHHARGWPWINPPGHVEWVYVPAMMPDQMAETESEDAA